jgi:hypothetical protein
VKKTFLSLILLASLVVAQAELTYSVDRSSVLYWGSQTNIVEYVAAVFPVDTQVYTGQYTGAIAAMYSSTNRVSIGSLFTGVRQGTYKVHVSAKDKNGIRSEWSEPIFLKWKK